MAYRWEQVFKAVKVNVAHTACAEFFNGLSFFLSFPLKLPCFFFITSPLSFHSAVGLQMSSGSSVTTIRSDCPSSVTKFGEETLTPHLGFVSRFCFKCDFAVVDNRTFHSVKRQVQFYCSSRGLGFVFIVKNSNKSQTWFKVKNWQTQSMLKEAFKDRFTTRIA